MLLYSPQNINPEINDRLRELHDHTSTTKGLLSALGNFWTDFYADQDAIADAATGAIVPLSRQFRELLKGILKSSILDIPECETIQIDLLSFSEENAVITEDDITFTNIDIQNVDYLVSSLFEPGVVLQKDVHYTVDPYAKIIRFNVDIFNDPAITKESWVYDQYGNITGTSRTEQIRNRRILFWGTNIVLASYYIYERYGRFLYSKAPDSDRYKWLIQALMFFYTNSKSVKNIEDVLNIMYGIPFAQREGEKVLDVYTVDKNLQRTSEFSDENYYAIETDYRTYYTWEYSEVTVKPGDVLSRFQLMASFHKVVDYISDPEWWKTAKFPSALVDGDAEAIPDTLKYELLDKVLKYNLLHVVLYKTLQTADTYDAQIAQVMELLKDSIPVYLYPIIGTVFRCHFDDGTVFPDEPNLDEDLDIFEFGLHLDLRDKATFPPIYNGDYTFGTHYMLVPEDADYKETEVNGFSTRRKTYGDEFPGYPVVYDGEQYFSDPFLRYGQLSDAPRYDGSRVFGAIPTLVHGSQQEYFNIYASAMHHWDKYVQPDYKRAIFTYAYFDGSLNYDGKYFFRMNMFPRQEMVITSTSNTEDTFDLSAVQEEFTVRQLNPGA